MERSTGSGVGAILVLRDRLDLISEGKIRPEAALPAQLEDDLLWALANWPGDPAVLRTLTSLKDKLVRIRAGEPVAEVWAGSATLVEVKHHPLGRMVVSLNGTSLRGYRVSSFNSRTAGALGELAEMAEAEVWLVGPQGLGADDFVPREEWLEFAKQYKIGVEELLVSDDGQATEQVEQLVRTARRALQKLLIEFNRAGGGGEGDSWAEAESLEDALRPFADLDT